MLQRREHELQKRRDHVENLLKWHQRLDDEEREVLEMERVLMLFSQTEAYGSKQSLVPAARLAKIPKPLSNGLDRSTDLAERSSSEMRQQKQIAEIEKSLKTLQNISTRSVTSTEDGQSSVVGEDSVEVDGKKLNKLWRRLTGRHEEKFQPGRRYNLSKSDLENLYEEAKSVVLQKFDSGTEIQRLMESSSILSQDTAKEVEETGTVESVEEKNPSPTVVASAEKVENVEIPTLNLNFSPEPVVESQKSNPPSDSDQGYYFTSDSNAGTDSFLNKLEDSPEKISEEIPSEKTSADEEKIAEECFKILYTDETFIKQNGQEDEKSVQEFPTHSTEYLTEDSLNNSKNRQLVENQASPVIESIETASESITSKVSEELDLEDQTFELNASNSTVIAVNNSTQLIDDISFPNIDITTIIHDNDYTANDDDDEPLVVNNDDDTSTKNSLNDKIISHANQESDDKYLSDDFEKTNSSDKNLCEMVTTISNSTFSITESNSPGHQTSRSPSPSRSRSPSKSKELEQRLIDIDDSLKDLNETLARSPVLELNAGDRSDSEKSSKSTMLEQSSVGDSEDGEDKENIAVSVANAVLSPKMDMKIRSKTANEGFPLTEIYPKTDAEVLDTPPTKLSTSPTNLIRDYSVFDYNKISETDVFRRQPVSIDQEVSSDLRSQEIQNF